MEIGGSHFMEVHDTIASQFIISLQKSAWVCSLISQWVSVCILKWFDVQAGNGIKGHFHFKLEKKFPQGAKKKYPCIEIIYDFFCQKYSKLHGKNVGIDLNLVL